MAVDWQKVFTIVGAYAGKIDAYYAYIDGFDIDKAAIEDILIAQNVVPLGDGLSDLYENQKQSVVDWVGVLINREEEVLTDEDLIGSNFSFGSSPTINQALSAIIHQMTEETQYVAPSVATVTSPTYDCFNAEVGRLVTGTLLDGYNSPMNGAISSPDYFELETQLVPDSETLTFVCTSDSETGGIRGSEIFSVKGTRGSSGPYSIDGESIGTLNSITVKDNDAAYYGTNLSFDTWSDNTEDPDGWESTAGAPNTDFVISTDTVIVDDGFSIEFTDTADVLLQQVLDSTIFTRKRAYWISVWGKRKTNLDAQGSVSFALYDDNGAIDGVVISPSTAGVWEHFSSQLLIPEQIVGDLVLKMSWLTLAGPYDPVIVDKITISTSEYMAGIAVAIFGGPDKFLLGDTIEITLSNDNAGLWQTHFRKAHRVQLPTNATPTISDELIT